MVCNSHVLCFLDANQQITLRKQLEQQHELNTTSQLAGCLSCILELKLQLIKHAPGTQQQVSIRFFSFRAKIMLGEGVRAFGKQVAAV